MQKQGQLIASRPCFLNSDVEVIDYFPQQPGTATAPQAGGSLTQAV